jgi:hypothetical protein
VTRYLAPLLPYNAAMYRYIASMSRVVASLPRGIATLYWVIALSHRCNASWPRVIGTFVPGHSSLYRDIVSRTGTEPR